MGDEMCYTCDVALYPAVEIPPKEFILMEGGPEAIDRELGQMKERRFNTDKPIPNHLKHTALECRLICTQKRDGTMKVRLVAKDLKSRRKLPATSTYAAVPAMYGVKMLVAAADGNIDIISTTDFITAYLQSPNKKDPTTWILVWYRDPYTGEKVYVNLMEIQSYRTSKNPLSKNVMLCMVMRPPQLTIFRVTITIFRATVTIFRIMLLFLESKLLFLEYPL